MGSRALGFYVIYSMSKIFNIFQDNASIVLFILTLEGTHPLIHPYGSNSVFRSKIRETYIRLIMKVGIASAKSATVSADENSITSTISEGSVV